MDANHANFNANRRRNWREDAIRANLAKYFKNWIFFIESIRANLRNVGVRIACPLSLCSILVPYFSAPYQPPFSDSLTFVDGQAFRNPAISPAFLEKMLVLAREQEAVLSSPHAVACSSGRTQQK